MASPMTSCVFNLADVDESAFKSSNSSDKVADECDGGSTACPDDNCSSIGLPCSHELPSPAPVHCALPPSKRVPAWCRAHPMESQLLARRRLSQRVAGRKVTAYLSVDAGHGNGAAAALRAAKHGLAQCFSGIRALVM